MNNEKEHHGESTEYKSVPAKPDMCREATLSSLIYIGFSEIAVAFESVEVLRFAWLRTFL